MTKRTNSTMLTTSIAAAMMPVTITCTGVIVAASFSCAAPLRMPMKADSTAFTTCSSPALRGCGSPGPVSAGAATIIPVSPRALPALHLEKRIRQRHRVHVLRQRGVDHERDRHALHLSRRQRLLREAETIELPEVARRK